MGKPPELENPFNRISAMLFEPAMVMSVAREPLKLGDIEARRIALDGFKYVGAGWEPGKLVIVDGYSNGRRPSRLIVFDAAGSVGIQEMGVCREYGRKRTGDSWDGQYHAFGWDPDGQLKQVEVGVAKYHGFFYEKGRGWKRQDTHELEFFRVNRPGIYEDLDPSTQAQFPYILTREEKELLGREIPWKIDYSAVASEVVAKAELEEFVKAFTIQSSQSS